MSDARNSNSNPGPRWLVIVYWVATALFCLEMLFTAWWELTQVQQSVPRFAQLGFASNAFRLELSWAKVLGVLLLLAPRLPARAREWAYCGFAINLVSAIIAHAAIHDVPASFLPSSITSVLWVGSYVCWRQLQTRRNAVG